MNSHELPKEHVFFSFFFVFFYTGTVAHLLFTAFNTWRALHFLPLTKPFSLISSTDEHRSHGEMKEETD